MKQITIGEPPLGEQTACIMLGETKRGGIIIQTEASWIVIPKEHVKEVGDALLNELYKEKEVG